MITFKARCCVGGGGDQHDAAGPPPQGVPEAARHRRVHHARRGRQVGFSTVLQNIYHS